MHYHLYEQIRFLKAIFLIKKGKNVQSEEEKILNHVFKLDLALKKDLQDFTFILLQVLS